MKDGFKASLSLIDKLMWVILSISAASFLVDPSAADIKILGLVINQSRFALIGPISIAGLMLARQIVIRNAAEIVSTYKQDKDLVQLVQSYPVMEFMRWRGKSGLEVLLLSIFQATVDFIPAFSVYLLVYGVFRYRWIEVIIAIIVVLLSLWNYSTLRRKVFEPLLGEIRTPD